MKCIVKLWNCEDEVFVKEIENKVSNSDVIKSSMKEDQVPKTFKFLNCKI